MNTVLQSPIEVYDDIAAKDDIEFVEASISSQIMRGEYDVCLQRTVQNGMVIAAGVVIGEAFLAAGFHIIITILRDAIHRINCRFGLPEHLFINVRGINPASLILTY